MKAIKNIKSSFLRTFLNIENTDNKVKKSDNDNLIKKDNSSYYLDEYQVDEEDLYDDELFPYTDESEQECKDDYSKQDLYNYKVLTTVDRLSAELKKSRATVIHYFYTGFPIRYKTKVSKYCNHVKYIKDN